MFIDLQDFTIIQILLDLNDKRKTGFLYLSSKACFDEKDILQDQNQKIVFLDQGEFACAFSQEFNVTYLLKFLNLLEGRKLSTIELYQEKKPIYAHLLNVFNLSERNIKSIFKHQITYAYELLAENFRYAYFEPVEQEGYPWKQLTNYRISIFDLYRDFLKQDFIGLQLEELLPDKNSSLEVIIEPENQDKVFFLEKDREWLNFLELSSPNISILKVAKTLNLDLISAQKMALYFSTIGLARETYPEDKLLRFTRRILPLAAGIPDFRLPLLQVKTFFPLVSYFLGKEGVIFTALFLGLFQAIDLSFLDLFTRLRGIKISDRVVLVTLSEKDLDFFGNYPLTDAQLYRVLNNIRVSSPAVVALDLYRNLNVAPGTAQLQALYGEFPQLVGTYKFVEPSVDPAEGMNLVGFADLVPDDDGVIRRNLLSVTNQSNDTQLSLGLFSALIYLQTVENLSFEQAEDGSTILGNTRFERLGKDSGLYYREDIGGYQTLLNFQHTINSFNSISWSDVYNNEIPPNFFQNKIVVIGAVAPSLNDYFETSFTSNNKSKTPGLVIHANAIENIVSAALEETPLLEPLDKFQELVVIGLWSIIGFLLACYLLFTFNHQKTKYNAYTINFYLLGILAIIGLNYLSFLILALVLPLAPTLLAFSSSYCLTLFKFSALAKTLLYRGKPSGFYNKSYFNIVCQEYLSYVNKENIIFYLAELSFERNCSFLNNNSLVDFRHNIENFLGNRGYVFRYSEKKFVFLLEKITGTEIVNLERELINLLDVILVSDRVNFGHLLVSTNRQSISSLLLQLSREKELLMN